MTTRYFATAAAAGVLAAVPIGVSPAGSAAVAALALLVWYASRGTSGLERRWIVGWLVATMAARVGAVSMLPMTVDRSRQSLATVFGGDAFYLLQRSIWIRNAFVDAPFAPRDFFEAFEGHYGWSGYNYALALLHVFFGPSPYAAHLVSTVMFFAAVVLLFRYVRSSYGRGAGFLGLAVLTTMPSLFLWSIAPLKEAPFSLLMAVAVVASVLMLRSHSWRRRIVFAAAIVLVLWVMRQIRSDAATLVAVALAAGAAGWAALRTVRTSAVAAVVVLLIVSAVIAWPRSRTLVVNQIRVAADRHIGHVFTAGHSYRLLDDDAYFGASYTADVLPLGPTSRFLIRAIARFFSVPEPWILKPDRELLLIGQQMVWYVLLALAVFGLVVGFRRDRLLTSLFAAFVVTGAMLIGPTSGNIGTLIRHRDTVAPFAIWLSAVGAARALTRAGGRRRLNVLDLTVGLMLLVVIPAGYALYLLFRTPPPRLLSIEPRVVHSPGRVTLRGEHLQPFLRAFVGPSGQPIRLLDRHDRPPEAAYATLTTSEADLRLPALAPGRYDLVLFDGADETARLSDAFRVDRMAEDPVGVVVAEGRFIRIEPGAAAGIVQGAQLMSSDATVALEILRTGADRPAIEPIGPGVIQTWARLEEQQEREATLRIRCQFTVNRCRYAGQPVVADGSLELRFPSGTLSFVIDAVTPDSADWPVVAGPTTDLLVDFVGWPEAEKHVRAGDRDAGAPLSRALRAAELVRVVAVERFVGDVGLDGWFDGERFALEEPLVRIRAVVRFAKLPSGIAEARNTPVRIGSRVTFETATYLLRGTIVGPVSPGSIQAQ